MINYDKIPKKRNPMTHTKVPWSFGVASGEIYAHGVSICRVYPGMLTSFHAPDVETQKANAEFIVTACNNHDALMEACEYGLRMLLQIGDESDYCTQTINDLTIALKKVREK